MGRRDAIPTGGPTVTQWHPQFAIIATDVLWPPDPDLPPNLKVIVGTVLIVGLAFQLQLINSGLFIKLINKTLSTDSACQ
jgi:hypothetical protein